MTNRIMMIVACACFTISVQGCAAMYQNTDEVDTAMREVNQEAQMLAPALNIDVGEAAKMLMRTKIVLHPQYSAAKYDYIWNNDKTLFNKVLLDTQLAETTITAAIRKRYDELQKLKHTHEEQMIAVKRADKLFAFYQSSGDSISAEIARIDFETEVAKLNVIGHQLKLPDYVPALPQRQKN